MKNWLKAIAATAAYFAILALLIWLFGEFILFFVGIAISCLLAYAAKKYFDERDQRWTK